MTRTLFLLITLGIGGGVQQSRGESLPGFRPSPWFGEQVREEWIGDGVRAIANADIKFDAKKPTQLLIYATPNGNSIEQTLGCSHQKGADFHVDIQHIAAQTRKLREITPKENIVLVITEGEGLSWPAWKRTHKDGPATIRQLVERIRSWIPSDRVITTLAGHSGGGSFLFGFLDGAEAIPKDVGRIIFLDANYSYSDTEQHGNKLSKWMAADQQHRLVVIAYDDRNITLNGKPVIGPTGGTFRATERMLKFFRNEISIRESTMGEIVHHSDLEGQLGFFVHSNPKNVILHTALVGEMNGFLLGMTFPEAKPAWGILTGPRAYTKWVQQSPGIPARPKDGIGGREFIRTVEKKSAIEREEAIVTEITRGNIPDFLRSFKKITITSKDTKGSEHLAVIEVMPDYLAIGSNEDFVRVPMTPRSAALIADQFGCSLPTRKIVDEVWKSATVKLEPKPMTNDRERPETFFEHHLLIEKARVGNKSGELVAGIKKDLVISNRLSEKPNREALYGWHKLDGSPIQPLTIVHGSSYVDYSHGVRLLKRSVNVDGKLRDIRPALYSQDSSPLVSDEGPITRPSY